MFGGSLRKGHPRFTHSVEGRRWHCVGARRTAAAPCAAESRKRLVGLVVLGEQGLGGVPVKAMFKPSHMGVAMGTPG